MRQICCILAPVVVTFCLSPVSGQDAAAVPKPKITIQPGTSIAVRTIELIDARHADLSRNYAASLADPIMVGNVQIAPRNADAALRVVSVQKAGVLSGKESLTLKLVSVKINGQNLAIETGTTVKQSVAQGNKTAATTALGGGLGAGVGAISGGGKGALIGAAGGAGVAIVMASLTGEHIQVARETRLTFSLTEAATVDALGPLPNQIAANKPVVAEIPHGVSISPFVQTVEGWLVTLQRCERNASISVTCYLTIANEKADRDLSINPDTNLIDSEGNQQVARMVQVGLTKVMNAKSPAKITIIPEAPVKATLEFGGVDLAIERVARLKIMLTWDRTNSYVEFRNVQLVSASH